MAGLNALAYAGSLGGLGSFAVSLDDEIQRLIRQHGKEAVREATKRLTKKKIGRPQEVDFTHLREWFDQDADDLLDGLDPFEVRANYAMAMHVANLAPVHQRASTHRRLMRKLSARRKWIVHAVAIERAEKFRPFSFYIRACEALLALGPIWQDMVEWRTDRLRGNIERYEARFGEIDASMTVLQIEEALKVPEPLTLDRGLAGLLGQYIR